MIKSSSPLLLLPVLFLFSGCGGGGGTSQRPKLSLSGRNADGLSITLTQQGATIARGQGNRYTLTLKNDTSRTRSFFVYQEAQGFSPADLTVTDSNNRTVFEYPDLTATLETVELRPNQVLQRAVVAPATAFASPGTYRAQAGFTNGSTGGDGASDILGPLEVRVR